MRRVFGFCAIALGLITLLVVGMLAHARRNDPAEWIIFSVQAGNYNSGKVDIYRVLADGTHTAKLISSFDGYPNLWWIPPHPGWLVLYDSDLRGQRLQLVHLMGHTKLVMNEPSTMWPSIYYFDRQHQLVYLTITDDWANNRTIWVMDLHTGERTPYELPLKLNYQRYRLGDEGYIYWSDHASAGDLYAMRFANPPHITPLTTGGQVIRDGANMGYNGWFYYFVDDGNPDPYVQLYRMRDDGTAVARVAEQVLMPDNAPSFGSDHLDTLYYWSGDPRQPHLVQANLDGSQPIVLPIPAFEGWARGWSPDGEWFYYSEVRRDPANMALNSGNLLRLNMQTGEHQLVWEGTGSRGLIWSADGQRMILVADRENSNGYSAVYRMQPDGTQTIQLINNLRSSNLGWSSNGGVIALGTWGTVGEELHLLDLRTLEIRPLSEDAPPGRIRQLLTTVAMPDFGWQVGGLGLMGLLLVVVGVGAAFPPIRH